MATRWGYARVAVEQVAVESFMKKHRMEEHTLAFPAGSIFCAVSNVILMFAQAFD